jgi:hypothetical protein
MSKKEEKALNLLFHSETYPGMVRKEASDIKLILWRNNTLGEYITWSFIETNECCILRRVIWKQRAEYNLNEPETFCADAIISKNMFTLLSDSFLKLNYDNIKVVGSKISIDGIEYGIIVQDKKFKWNDESLLSCYELSKLFKNTVTELETMFL